MKRIASSLRDILNPATDAVDTRADLQQLQQGAKIKTRAIQILQKISRHKTNERIARVLSHCRGALGERRGLEAKSSGLFYKQDPSVKLEKTLATVSGTSFGNAAAQRLRRSVDEALSDRDTVEFEKLIAGDSMDLLLLELMAKDDDDELLEAALSFLLERHRTVRALGAALSKVTVISPTTPLSVFEDCARLTQLMFKLRVAMETIGAAFSNITFHFIVL